jgi:hypothetical protein
MWPGATVLVAGVSGVGKSVMALQRGIRVTFESAVRPPRTETYRDRSARIRPAQIREHPTVYRLGAGAHPWRSGRRLVTEPRQDAIECVLPSLQLMPHVGIRGPCHFSSEVAEIELQALSQHSTSSELSSIFMVEASFLPPGRAVRP